MPLEGSSSSRPSGLMMISGFISGNFLSFIKLSGLLFNKTFLKKNHNLEINLLLHIYKKKYCIAYFIIIKRCISKEHIVCLHLY